MNVNDAYRKICNKYPTLIFRYAYDGSKTYGGTGDEATRFVFRDANYNDYDFDMWGNYWFTSVVDEESKFVAFGY